MSAPKLDDITTSLALLTRLPVKASFDRTAEASWAYPLAGTILAVLAGLLACVALWLGIDPAMAAGIYVTSTVVLSGAMHEDGLADLADGFWGGWDPARRLAIMKDSAIGAYGVIALTLGLVARWVAVWALMDHGGWFWALIAVETLSRSAMPALMHVLPNARDSGLSQSQGRPSRETAALGVAIATVIALVMVGLTAIGLLLLGAVAAFGMAKLAQAKIGGQTGDVLGATQQIVALVLLMVLA